MTAKFEVMQNEETLEINGGAVPPLVVLGVVVFVASGLMSCANGYVDESGK